MLSEWDKEELKTLLCFIVFEHTSVLTNKWWILITRAISLSRPSLKYGVVSSVSFIIHFYFIQLRLWPELPQLYVLFILGSYRSIRGGGGLFPLSGLSWRPLRCCVREHCMCGISSYWEGKKNIKANCRSSFIFSIKLNLLPLPEHCLSFNTYLCVMHISIIYHATLALATSAL